MAATYIGTQDGQTVSRNALSNAVSLGIFRVKNGVSPDTRQITKSEADNDVYIDTAYASYAAKAANQLVYKRDLFPDYENSGLFYYDFNIKFVYSGWNSDGNSCINYTAGTPMYIAWNGVLGVGTLIFTFSINQINTGAGEYPTLYYFVIVSGGTPYAVTFTSAYGYYNTPFGFGYTVATIAACSVGLSVVNFYMIQYDDGFGTYWAEASIILDGAVTQATTFYVDFNFNGYQYNGIPVYFQIGDTQILDANLTGGTSGGGLYSTCLSSVSGDPVNINLFAC